jgi:hypothetical protein
VPGTFVRAREYSEGNCQREKEPQPKADRFDGREERGGNKGKGKKKYI